MTPRRSTIIKRIIKWTVVLGVLVGGPLLIWGPARIQAAAAEAYTIITGTSKPTSSGQEIRFEVVARKTFPISTQERGQLRAVKQHNISCQLYKGKIEWVIAEGKTVKKGETLIRFEVKPIDDQIRNLKGELEKAQRQQVVAEENVKIEEQSGRTQVANSQAQLEEADKALKQFRELDGPKRFREMEGQTNASRKGLEDANKALRDAQAKADEEMFVDEAQQENLEKQITAARSQVKSAAKGVEVAVLAHKMFKTYDYPQQLKAKQQAVDNAQLSLKKSQVSAQSSMVSRQAELGQIRDHIKRMTNDIKRQEKDKAKCIVAAPIDGMVIYGDAGSGGRNHYYGNSSNGEVKVGNEYYQGNTIMHIPDCSSFEIDISIGEEYRGRIQAGNKALITIEAIPGLVLEGKVKKIEGLAQPRSPWDTNGPKAFASVVELKNCDARMISGMSAQVDIVSEVVQDALAVNIEGVFNQDGQTVCFVKTPSGHEMRVVKTGRCSDDLTEIVEGLQEGQSIYLHHPMQMTK